MRIAEVVAGTYRIPLAEPWVSAKYRITHHEYVVTEVRTECGRIGTGWCQTIGLGGLAVEQLLSAYLAPTLVGEDPCNTERIWSRLWDECHFLGPAGITVAVIRKDLLGRHGRDLPPIFEWQNQVKNDSMFNTPPTFPWYVVGLVLKWMIAEGGLSVFAARNAEKSALLYSSIDSSDGFYRNEVEVSARSSMNVPFMLKDEALDKAFLKESEAAGLMGLKGHRALGGMRASIYNAMPLQGVQALVEFMNDFAVRNG